MAGSSSFPRLARVLLLCLCFLQSVCEDDKPTDSKKVEELKISGTEEPLSVTKEENDELLKPGLGLRKNEDGKTSAHSDSTNVSIHDKIVEIQQQDLGKTKEMKDDGKKEDGKKEDGVKEDGMKEDGKKEDGKKEDGKKEDGEKGDGEKGDGEKENGEKADGEKEDGKEQESGTEEQKKEKVEEKENIEEKGIDLKVLNDNDFEHLTQASTGATTGDWLVLL